MTMSFLKRSYPNQLANYTGDHLPDALDLITAGLTTQTPIDGRQMNRRRRHRHCKELDLEVFCRQQPTAADNAGISSPALRRGSLAEFWRKRRKTGRRRRRQPGDRWSAGTLSRRSSGAQTWDGEGPTTLERDVGNNDGGRSSTFVVTGASNAADGALSNITAASVDALSPDDSEAADWKGENVTAYNATGPDLYFKTAHVLHYASIVILGLFVLQVARFRTFCC